MCIGENKNMKSYNKKQLIASIYEKIYKHNHYVWGYNHSNELYMIRGNLHGKTLDFGCGYGRNITFLSSLYCSVVGIDISATAISLAEEYIYKHNVKNVTLIQGDENLIEPGSYDGIVCFGVLEDHDEKNRMEIVKNLQQGLKRNGELLVGVFGGNKDFRHKLSSTFKQNVIHPICFAVHYFTEEELISLFDMIDPIKFISRRSNPNIFNPEGFQFLVLYGRKM